MKKMIKQNDQDGVYPRIFVDPEKIEAMMSWPTPRNLIDIRSFVGLAGYCRKLNKED